ncbi:hypothetical protein JK628_05145 [Shewanella sp. KX20019]|uniref:glutaredoxin family protein n=1 Tax=Shewanella sp. KX20019 TaxID=2803864 RepID=UPI0019252BDD|nr:glutaredoxin domain-containing protein [Shewanella sp. KX20019]QQX81259.1 hypothetical protein JK628_05145 [Shewanella sp. KX20019]
MSSGWLTKIKNVASYALIIAVGLGLGLGAKQGWQWYNQVPAYVDINTQAHFEKTNNKVVIYTTQWCPYCKKAKEYLTENNIAFTERDIEQGDAATDELYSSIDLAGVPKIVIGNRIINGFNQSLLATELTKHNLL